MMMMMMTIVIVIKITVVESVIDRIKVDAFSEQSGRYASAVVDRGEVQSCCFLRRHIIDSRSSQQLQTHTSMSIWKPRVYKPIYHSSPLRPHRDPAPTPLGDLQSMIFHVPDLPNLGDPSNRRRSPVIWTTHQLGKKITISISDTDPNPNPKFCRPIVRFFSRSWLSPSRVSPEDRAPKHVKGPVQNIISPAMMKVRI